MVTVASLTAERGPHHQNANQDRPREGKSATNYHLVCNFLTASHDQDFTGRAFLKLRSPQL